MMSDGIRSGVNWMRLKLSAKRLARGLDHQGFAQAGHAFDQHVAAAKQCGQDLADDLLMAHDYAANFALDPAKNFTKLGHAIFGPGLCSGSHRFSLLSQQVTVARRNELTFVGLGRDALILERKVLVRHGRRGAFVVDH